MLVLVCDCLPARPASQSSLPNLWRRSWADVPSRGVGDHPTFKKPTQYFEHLHINFLFFSSKLHMN